jgi:hypothetical protein
LPQWSVATSVLVVLASPLASGCGEAPVLQTRGHAEGAAKPKELPVELPVKPKELPLATVEGHIACWRSRKRLQEIFGISPQTVERIPRELRAERLRDYPEDIKSQLRCQLKARSCENVAPAARPSVCNVSKCDKWYFPAKLKLSSGIVHTSSRSVTNMLQWGENLRERVEGERVEHCFVTPYPTEELVVLALTTAAEDVATIVVAEHEIATLQLEQLPEWAHHHARALGGFRVLADDAPDREELRVWSAVVSTDVRRGEENIGGTFFWPERVEDMIQVQIDAYELYLQKYGDGGRFAERAVSERNRLVAAKLEFQRNQAALEKWQAESVREAWQNIARRLSERSLAEGEGINRVWTCEVTCEVGTVFFPCKDAPAVRKVGTVGVTAATLFGAYVDAASKAGDACKGCGQKVIKRCQ